MNYSYKLSSVIIEGERHNTYDIYIENDNAVLNKLSDFSTDVDEVISFINYLEIYQISSEKLIEAAQDFLDRL